MFDLKPCPFCGSENATLDNDYLPKYFVPKCKDCGLSHGLFDSYKQAIEAWNYRPIEDALRAENEKMRKVLNRIKLQYDDFADAYRCVACLEIEPNHSDDCDLAPLLETKQEGEK